jgi:hypothetical protein
MSDPVDQTISAYCAKIQEHERAAAKIKALINQMLELEGRPPMFTEAELQTSRPGLNIRADQFYNKPFASCVRAVLDLRGTMNQGAASIDELYDALIAGGFNFEQKDEAVAKRNLAISLGKNTATFARLPNGMWGLKEWYPAAARVKLREGVQILGATAGRELLSGTGKATPADAANGNSAVAAKREPNNETEPSAEAGAEDA